VLKRVGIFLGAALLEKELHKDLEKKTLCNPLMALCHRKKADPGTGSKGKERRMLGPERREPIPSGGFSCECNETKLDAIVEFLSVCEKSWDG